MYKQLQQRGAERPPVNISTLASMKSKGQKIACMTCYDASFAVLVDEAGVDLVLVGDSLGMVIQGYDTTVPVTVDDIIYHSRAVARALVRPLLVADMPFMSYSTPEQALNNAVRLMQEGGAQMVKLEGGAGQVEVVKYLASHDIPICAHLGLKPQSVHKIGGFRVQGRDGDTASAMRKDAKMLQDAGADIVLLECIPSDLGSLIAKDLHVPVIGIGAGPDVDGQILVLYDILDITSGRKPRFVKNFMLEGGSPLGGIEAFCLEVKDGTYPGPEHGFS
jgi:3-methyl-2-oxobutanoate hydroxymethyltransferase